MAARIEAPNGEIVEFPDGTPDETIVGVMKREYGQKTSTAADVAKSLGTGIVKGGLGLATLPGNMRALAHAGLDYIAPETAKSIRAQEDAAHKSLEGSPLLQWFASPKSLPTVHDAQKKVEEYTGEFHKPQTRMGRYAETTGEFAPGLMMGPGNWVQRGINQVVAPAITSEAAGQATEGTKWEAPARIAGALVGGMVPRMAMRAVTPFPASAERNAQANLLRNEGVDLTAGQATGNRNLRYAESVATETPFGGTGISDILERQKGQFTAAANRRMGEVADVATPDVLRGARDRIGAEFDRLTHGNDIVFSGRGAGAGGHAGRARARALQNNTLRLEAEYNNTVVPSMRKLDATELVDEVNNAITAGRIAGPSYQTWRSRLGTMSQNATDAAERRFLSGLRDAMDDAMESGLSTADATAWRQARQQWGHLAEVRDAMATGTEAASLGSITPTRLGMADRHANKTGFVEGEGRYDDLARAGDAVMKDLPNSGTPARLTMQNMPAALATGMLSHMGGGDPAMSLSAAMAGGIAGPALQSRIVSNPIIQAYFANQALAAPLNALGNERSVINALLQGANQSVPQGAP